MLGLLLLKRKKKPEAKKKKTQFVDFLFPLFKRDFYVYMMTIFKVLYELLVKGRELCIYKVLT